MSDPIETLQGLIREMEQHAKRLSAQRQRDPSIGEIADTMMPFLIDVASSVLAELLGTRQYLHDEVESLLQAAVGEESQLLPEDSELIMLRLQGYRSLLAEARVSVPPEKLVEVEAEIAEIDKAIELVTEVTLEDEEPEAEGEPEADAEDAEDETPPKKA